MRLVKSAVVTEQPFAKHAATGSCMRIADLSRVKPIPLHAYAWQLPTGWWRDVRFPETERTARMTWSDQRISPS